MQDTRVTEADSLFRNRPFMLLWVAQAISQTAQNGIFFVLMVVITEATGSATYLSLLVFSTILPSLLFGLAAGVMVDRQSKRLILIGSNVFRAVLVVGYLGANDNLVIIYLVNLVFATISQFFAPAELSTIALLVPKSLLMRANGFFNLTFTASQFAGLVFPVPVVVKIFGTYWTLVAMAGAYVIATGLVAFLPRDHSARAPSPGQGFLFGLWAELKEGWGFIRSRPIITFAMLNMTTATTLILVLSVVAAPFVKRILGIRADDAVYILAPAGLGVGLGAILCPRLVKSLPSPRLINSAMVAFAVCLLGFGSTNWVGRYLAYGLSEAAVIQWLLAAVIPLAFVMGLAFALITIPAQTLLQEHCPAALRGKIFATQLTMGNVASVLPFLFIGGLADLFGIAQVIILVGIAVLGIGLFSMRRYRRLSAAGGASS
ncbi:MAG: MFS transporter [Dehalococcoidia bacterium]|nr:MFS transporter [Dehalococcoidia bacterium]